MSMKLFSKKFMDSRVRSANTTKSEMCLGYFFGPCLLYMCYYGIAGTYLTQFYTDVLQISGIFLTLMPIFSKIVDALTNIVMGHIIDRTRTRQGKARPWILISGVLIAVTGILLYAVPRASYGVQITWVIISYNLFFAFAFTIYNMAHTLMVPLSTRNTKQRDGLALLSSAGCSMIPGTLTTVVMPLLIVDLGVGDAARGPWLQLMSVLSILAIPATLLEYYFTKERVTEDAMASGEETARTVSMREQLLACFHDPYWLIIMGFTALYQIQQNLMSSSMIYYANWVIGSSVESGAAAQVLINVVGQGPLGIGILILWPLAKKVGKRKLMMYGLGIASVGCFLVFVCRGGLAPVLGCMALRSVGLVPTYLMSAQLAESLDHIEWKNGYRADGLSASIYSILMTVSAGVAQSILLAGINGLGYIAPASSTQVIEQSPAVKFFFTFCFVGASCIAFLIGSLLMMKFDVEDKMPQISADLTARHRAEAEARGEVFVSMEERAAREEAEQERLAEEKRIEDLRARCEKKGLSFEAEEAKYQAKLARKSKRKKKEQSKA